MDTEVPFVVTPEMNKAASELARRILAGTERMPRDEMEMHQAVMRIASEYVTKN